MATVRIEECETAEPQDRERPNVPIEKGQRPIGKDLVFRNRNASCHVGSWNVGSCQILWEIGNLDCARLHRGEAEIVLELCGKGLRAHAVWKDVGADGECCGIFLIDLPAAAVDRQIHSRGEGDEFPIAKAQRTCNTYLERCHRRNNILESA